MAERGNIISGGRVISQPRAVPGRAPRALFSFHYTMLQRVIIALIIRSKGRSPPRPSSPRNWRGIFYRAASIFPTGESKAFDDRRTPHHYVAKRDDQRFPTRSRSVRSTQVPDRPYVLVVSSHVVIYNRRSSWPVVDFCAFPDAAAAAVATTSS